MIVAVGCSGERRQTIEGAVTLKGEPLTSGVVQFHGPGDRLVTAVIQPNGTFVATDLLSGEVKVAVVEDPSGGKPVGMPLPMGKAPPKGGEPLPGGPAPAKRTPIPTKYKDPKTSQLTYTITSDTKRIDIKMDE